MSESVHISVRINRNVADVYRYASNIENLEHWAAGVSPDMQVRFAKNNYFGVLDHWVTVGGQTFYNPVRVIEDGSGKSEVVFTLRDGSEEDATAIATDLATLKAILEG